MRSLHCFALAVSLLLPAAARADFIITGSDAVVGPGGTGTVDFTITSTNPTVDNLAAFNLELLITPTAGTSFLQFTTSQPDFSTVSSYVFVGNSGVGAAFWGAPFSTNTANDTIAGGDFTLDGSGVPIGQSYLLARVQFQADPHASNGDTFTIGLVADPNQTYFLDAGGNSIAYTSSDATVEAQAAPAPSSLVLAGTGGAAALVYGRRRRRLV
jgi:hypothetical protein